MLKGRLSPMLGMFVLAMCSAEVVAQDPLPAGAFATKQKIAEQHRILLDTETTDEQKIRSEGGLAPMNICRGFFTVVESDIWEDPHITKDDAFLMVGPLPVSSNIQVTPVGASHSWAPGHYKAVPDPSMEGWYSMEPVGVTKPPKHDESRNHYYRLEVTDKDSDGCPVYVRIHFYKHEGQTIILHDPGHAGTSRN